MTTQIKKENQLIGKGLHDDFPAICIQDYETNKFVWFNVYEIFQNSNDLEEFQEHMTKARKSICRDEWFYPDCQYLHSIYSENMSDETLFEYLESLDDAISDGHSVSLHEEFIGAFGDSYFGSLNEMYYGEFNSQKECAENYVEETINLDDVPDLISSNINYESLYHDLDFTEIEADKTTYYFRNY
jgi:hypothetical protein